ncbi:MAG: hypothetical protein KAV83_07920, partial [Desulfobacterales bacterium]|nr:hypothetical protein [Desulfobacterales bacterium]
LRFDPKGLLTPRVFDPKGLIADNFTQNQIPYSLIGALASGLYGIPRYTADIDLLTEGRCWSLICPIIERLGYTCYQKTESFAQFDSELGVLGKIDFMFVSTPDGKDILQRSVLVRDELMGNHPIIQPTDYIILKLMAIANNPERGPKDEADIFEVLKLYKKHLIPKNLGPLDMDRIYLFADKFGQKMQVQKYFEKVFDVSDKPGSFKL